MKMTENNDTNQTEPTVSGSENPLKATEANTVAQPDATRANDLPVAVSVHTPTTTPESKDPTVDSLRAEDGLTTETGVKSLPGLSRRAETTPLAARVERPGETLPAAMELRLLSERVEDMKASFTRAYPQFLALFENHQYHDKTKVLLEDFLRLVLSAVKLFPGETFSMGDWVLVTAPDQQKGQRASVRFCLYRFNRKYLIIRDVPVPEEVH